jgi:hypothetical protein
VGVVGILAVVAAVLFLFSWSFIVGFVMRVLSSFSSRRRDPSSDQPLDLRVLP